MEGRRGGGKAVNGRKLERCVSETLIGVMEYVVVRWVHNRTQEVFLSRVNLCHPASDREIFSIPLYVRLHHWIDLQ